MQNTPNPIFNKDILFSGSAASKLKQGIDKLANAVRVTLGPKGRNVIIDRLFDNPIITNDGVSIAKEIKLKDRFENAGAQLLKQVAEKTNQVAGDGTTTAIILAHAMISEGLKMVTSGIDPMSIKRGMDSAKDIAVAQLNDLKKTVSSKEELTQVATISSEDPEAGKLIAEVMHTIGKDGIITVEEGNTFGLESEMVNGLQFEKGYSTPYMITNHEKLEAEVRDPMILVTDFKLSAIQEVVPLMENLSRHGKKDLVIIADSITGEAMATLIINKLKGMFNVLAIEAPGTGLRKKELLLDICAVTGATLLSEDTGQKVENAAIDMLGKADRVVSSRYNTIIVGGKGIKEVIDGRIKELTKAISDQKNEAEASYFKSRLAKIKGGVAIIKVGAATEAEITYKKMKLEDAINATRAALEEGVIPGGGSAFITVYRNMLLGLTDKKITDENIGIKILMDALKEPFKQLAENSGIKESSTLISYVFADNIGGWDFKVTDPNDLSKGKVEDMFKYGIIDPLKVVRSGLENAVSVAGIFLTTECVLANDQDDINRFEEHLK
jgi:chaperonin GroEL